MSTVFFADVLGFSEMASAPGARPAVDALADLARLFAEDPLARYLAPSAGWSARYGLSDSMFLKGRNATVAETALRHSGLERVRDKIQDRSIVARLEELLL